MTNTSNMSKIEVCNMVIGNIYEIDNYFSELISLTVCHIPEDTKNYYLLKFADDSIRAHKSNDCYIQAFTHKIYVRDMSIKHIYIVKGICLTLTEKVSLGIDSDFKPQFLLVFSNGLSCSINTWDDIYQAFKNAQ